MSGRRDPRDGGKKGMESPVFYLFRRLAKENRGKILHKSFFSSIFATFNSCSKFILGTSINCLFGNLEGFLEDIAKQKEGAM